MASSAIHLTNLRETPPLVQCITNYVAMNIAANTLLAVGASPAMVHTPEESGEFASLSSALTINMGTPSPTWVQGMVEAASVARERSIPWVLDPVAHFATGYRREVVATLLGLSPTVIRGNASEILALAGSASQGQGVDSGDAVEDAERAGRVLAKRQGAVIAITGEVDYVTDGDRQVRIRGGSSWMPRVTAMGCSLTAVVGALVAASTEPFDGTVAALEIFGVCGASAHRNAKGPGSFQVAFLDALASIEPTELAKSTLVEAL